MTKMPDVLTDLPKSSDEELRPLNDLLSLIRLSGAIFLRAEFTSPWAYESPSGAELIAALSPQSKRLLLFHIIAEGDCWVRTEAGDEVAVGAGDVVVLPYADKHFVGGAEPATPVPVVSLLEPLPWTVFPAIQWGGGGQRTTIVCGYLRCDDPIFDPVVRALPPLFSVSPAGEAASWVAASIEYARRASTAGDAAEGGIGVRLPELVLREVLRLYLASREPRLRGWLAALQDPTVGRALKRIHGQPERRWTAELLAREAACSRSTLDERFRRLLGRSAMQYLADWRLRLASALLKDTPLGVAAVAYRVGYESEEAFNRAFKRATGAPPAHWRRTATT
jgi:AraC-like DNA-binding protein